MVWSVVVFLSLIFYVDILKIADCVEGGVTEKAAVCFVIALYVEVGEEVGDELGCAVLFGDGLARLASVREC